MKKLFGTDGVRGIANQKLTPKLAFDLGRAGGYVLTKNISGAPKVLIAKDGRRSGDMLEAALIAGLCSIGAEVFTAGVIPTPAVAHLIKKYKLDAGVMISASHNAFEDNGIKFFNASGLKLSDDLEEEIETIIHTEKPLPAPTGADVGVVKNCPYALDDYASFIVSTVPSLRLEGVKIAIDCANGATSVVAPVVFEKLGAEVHTLHHRPNGVNINANCGSTHMDSLATFVTGHGMDIGIAFDGDGDRMLAVDGNGNLVDGDIIMAICALELKNQSQLEKDTLVATVMSNQGLEIFCNQHGIHLERTAVGDRYVLQKMLEENLTLGGEQSGHVIFSKYNTTGDGILAAVQLLASLYRQKQTLAQLAKIVDVLPQVLVNVRVASMDKLNTCEKIQAAKAEVEEALVGDGRLLLRASGTEPLVRVMIEGRDLDNITALANSLAGVIKESLG